MGVHIKKEHNKTLLMYHVVAVVKYRKSLISKEIGNFIKEICLELSERFEIIFIEIGFEDDHVHFLLQSVPTISVTKIVQLLKGNLSRQIFLKFPEIKKQLWGGEFWTSGFYANTVSQYGGEKTIIRYIQNQGNPKTSYTKLYDNQILSQDLFSS